MRVVKVRLKTIQGDRNVWGDFEDPPQYCGFDVFWGSAKHGATFEQ